MAEKSIEGLDGGMNNFDNHIAAHTNHPVRMKLRCRRRKDVYGVSDLGPVKLDTNEGKEFIQGRENSDVAYGGAVWDIFRRQDVPKLIEFLLKHQSEFHHNSNLPVNVVYHPIHDQTLYLNERHKKQLKEEFDVEPWTFEQRLGEAVFIPAGCPHQVRNRQSCIKVALDFVSPDNVEECIRLTEEFRLLPRYHRAKEDKLEVKKMALYAVSSAVAEAKNLIMKHEVPRPTSLVDQTPQPPHRPLPFLEESGGRVYNKEDKSVSNLTNDGSGLTKRFRTKFTQEQKEKMLMFAEQIRGKVNNHNEAAVDQFCAEIGVKKPILKVWMNNNRHTIWRKGYEMAVGAANATEDSRCSSKQDEEGRFVSNYCN